MRALIFRSALVAASLGSAVAAGSSSALAAPIETVKPKFAANQYVQTPNRPYAPAIGDIDRDGNLDVVTTDAFTTTVTILLGRGDGTFVDAQVLDIGVINVESIALADLQGDGWLDIVVGDHDGEVVELLSTGGGQFAPPALTHVGGGTRGLAAADMDDDGDIDVVASADTAVAVLSNDGTGALTPTLYPYGGELATGVATGDLDLDGQLDIAVAATFSDSVFWLLANDTGGYDVGGSAHVGGDDVFSRVEDVAIGDFTGDDRLDLVTANDLANSVSLLVGDGAGGFASPTDSPTRAWPTSLDVADFNQDGALDVAAIGGEDGNVLSGSDSTAGFVRNDRYGRHNIWSERSAVGDLNSDGWPDVVRADFNDQDRLILNLNRTGHVTHGRRSARHFGAHTAALPS